VVLSDDFTYSVDLHGIITSTFSWIFVDSMLLPLGMIQFFAPSKISKTTVMPKSWAFYLMMPRVFT